MRTKTTFVLLALAVACGLYIKFVESKRPNTEEAARQRQYVVNIKPETIDGILIQNGDDKIELRRMDKSWRIEAPIKDRADVGLINNFLSDLESWRREATIPAKEIEADKAKLKEYGVDKTRLRLKLLGTETPLEILFGKDAAVEKAMYVRVNGSKETFIASQNIRDVLTKKPEEFRDKKLTELTASQITRWVLKSASGELEALKNGDHWDLMKPVRARANDQKVADLLTKIVTAQIQRFVADDRGDLHEYGLTEPHGSIALFGAADKVGESLQFGAKVPNSENIYVRFAARNAVYELPKKIEEVLNTAPNDLRDRNLTRIDTNILDRLTIEGAGAPKIILARKGEKWVMASRNQQVANADEVNRLIEFLRNQQVSGFTEDGAADLAKFGLDKPRLQITFSSFASENTAETNAGDHPFLTLSFGRAEGENVFARIAEEPFVVSVPKAVVEAIWTDPIRWQELSIFKDKPESVQKLTVKNEGELSFVRAGNEAWRRVQGAGEPDIVNLQSLLNTLSSLRAVRWTSVGASDAGIDQPQLTVTFSKAADGKDSRKLLIGKSAGDGFWYAHVDGTEGNFVIANPDYTALRLPLLRGASKPAITPSASNPAPR